MKLSLRRPAATFVIVVVVAIRTVMWGCWVRQNAVNKTHDCDEDTVCRLCHWHRFYTKPKLIALSITLVRSGTPSMLHVAKLLMCFRKII